MRAKAAPKRREKRWLEVFMVGKKEGMVRARAVSRIQRRYFILSAMISFLRSRGRIA